MTDTPFPDEWLLHSLEGVLTAERLAELRAKAGRRQTLWETLVEEKIATNEQILAALSTRFRLKVADVARLNPEIKTQVPEQLARRFRVLPLIITDSYLEVATANPFDLDAEKALAFATAREIRTVLLDPLRIAAAERARRVPGQQRLDARFVLVRHGQPRSTPAACSNSAKRLRA